MSPINIKSLLLFGNIIWFLSILLFALNILLTPFFIVFSSLNNFKNKETILTLLYISSGTIKGGNLFNSNFILEFSLIKFKIGNFSKKLMKLFGISIYIWIFLDI